VGKKLLQIIPEEPDQQDRVRVENHEAPQGLQGMYEVGLDRIARDIEAGGYFLMVHALLPAQGKDQLLLWREMVQRIPEPPLIFLGDQLIFHRVQGSRDHSYQLFSGAGLSAWHALSPKRKLNTILGRFY